MPSGMALTAAAGTSACSAKPPTNDVPTTRSPGAKGTPSPTAITSPASSLPGVNGAGIFSWYLPSISSTSGKLTAAARTRPPACRVRVSGRAAPAAPDLPAARTARRRSRASGHPQPTKAERHQVIHIGPLRSPAGIEVATHGRQGSAKDQIGIPVGVVAAEFADRCGEQITQRRQDVLIRARPVGTARQLGAGGAAQAQQVRVGQLRQGAPDPTRDLGFRCGLLGQLMLR